MTRQFALPVVLTLFFASAFATETTYEYDANGNRTAKTVDGEKFEYVIDENRALPVVTAVLNEAGNPILTITHGPSDEIISMNRLDIGEIYFFHYDGSGNVSMLTDTNGNRIAEYKYTAFGEITYAEGMAADNNDYLFAGQQLDRETGHYHMRARYMDPRTGRFTQADPFPGVQSQPQSLNKYTYAHNDPVNRRDPSGLFAGGLAEVGAATNIRAIQASAALNVLGVITLAGSAKTAQLFQPTPADIHLGKFQVRRCIATGERNCRARIPVIIYGSDVDAVTQHIFDAQNFQGLPGALAKLANRTANDRPSGWRLKKPECAGKVGGTTGNHCDEYPFAITEQGGSHRYPHGVSLRPVAAGTNRLAGTRLASFFRKCSVTHTSSTKKWFGVVAVPGLPVTVPVCRDLSSR